MGNARAWLLAVAILTVPVWVSAQKAQPPVVRIPTVKPYQARCHPHRRYRHKRSRKRSCSTSCAVNASRLTRRRQGAQEKSNAQRTADERRYEQRRLASGLTHKSGQGDDCDDSRAEVHRLAAETCDNHDNNCDGFVDEGQKLALFLDADGDGHGDPRQRIDACPVDQQQAASEGRWLVPVGNDCNDANSGQWQGCP